MSSPQEEAQKFVTESVVTVLEFDFTPVGGNGSVFIANSKERLGDLSERVLELNGQQYQWIDFVAGGFRNDLTGQPNEPTLKIAAYDLWQIPDWASETAGFTLNDYQGITVLRQRFFYNTPTLIAPQKFYIKQVGSLSSTEIEFNLSGSYDSENLNRPSARRLEA